MKYLKKTRNLKFAILVLLSVNLLIVKGQDDKTTKYRRSSLTMVLVENNDLGKNKDMVVNAYNAFPFPDKYNLHKIVDNKLNTADKQMILSIDDYKKAGFYKDTLKTPMDMIKAKSKNPLNKIKYFDETNTKGFLEPTREEIVNIQINKYIKEKNIAKQMVASWFNRKSDGKMDWDLWKQRAAYSASQSEKDGGDSKQGLTDKMLRDVDVIGNSFIVFNYMDFYENEPVARFLRDVAKAEVTKQLAGKPQFLIDKSMQLLDKAYDLTKEGYTVKCNTYLYQLDWSEAIAKQTKNWFFNNDLDLTKSHKIWDTTSLYKMKFVGKTVSLSIVVGGTKTVEEIITLQVKRTMDNALSKLQRAYVVFRPVSPIFETNPFLIAQIGIKEGVENGDKYEILKSEEDQFGIPKWKSIGKVKVDKKKVIWDNRPNAEPLKDKDGKDIPVLPYTTFKGGKKAVAGMHYIRFLK